MTLFEKLQDAIAVALRVPLGAITPLTKDEDIATWDSLGHVKLMMTLGETFGIPIEVEDFAKLNSVSAIMEYLKAHGIFDPASLN